MRLLNLLLFLLILFINIYTNILVLTNAYEVTNGDNTVINVYHLCHYDHGIQFNGQEICQYNNKSTNTVSKLTCNWYTNDTLDDLQHTIEKTLLFNRISMTLYNIHTLWKRTHALKPHRCKLNTNYSIVESAESHGNYQHMFKPAFPHFDGISTTHPSSQIQRIYDEAYVTEDMLLPLIPFENLIKGASFVSSHCLSLDKPNSRRDNFVKDLRRLGLRVDGLGNCLRSDNVQRIEYTGDTPKDLIVKRKAISNYMFYFAFENRVEDGYVTEKIFDGLIAGTVPVYLGDSKHCKEIIPDNKSVIFISDFGNNINSLYDYLNHLLTNKTAYELHRQWRYYYNSTEHISNNIHLKDSWHCKVCQWAYYMYNSNIHSKHKNVKC